MGGLASLSHPLLGAWVVLAGAVPQDIGPPIFFPVALMTNVSFLGILDFKVLLTVTVDSQNPYSLRMSHTHAIPRPVLPLLLTQHNNHSEVSIDF